MFPVMRTRTPELTVEQIREKLCNLLCNYRESTKATSLPETQLLKKMSFRWNLCRYTQDLDLGERLIVCGNDLLSHGLCFWLVAPKLSLGPGKK